MGYDRTAANPWVSTQATVTTAGYATVSDIAVTSGATANYIATCADSGGRLSWKTITEAIASHTHPASDIVSGLLALARGGTNNASYTASQYLTYNGSALVSSGQTSATFATSSHGHTGVYEPANANIQNHISSTLNPHSVTQTQIGLGNVENTALSTWVGTTNITTVGTIATGVWGGTTIAADKGGTGQSAYAVGDLLYASTTSALSKLAAVATGSYYASQGVGVPGAWATLNQAAVDGLTTASSPSFTAATLSGALTVNMPTTSAPLVLGVNGQGQLVAGLNADYVDGSHSSAFATSGHNHDTGYLKLDCSNDPLTGDLEIGTNGGGARALYLYSGNTGDYLYAVGEADGDVNLRAVGTGDMTIDSATGTTNVRSGVGQGLYLDTSTTLYIRDLAYRNRLEISGNTGTINNLAGDYQTNGTTRLSAAGAATLTQCDVDNLRLDGNTISSTDTNGNVNITPNGTGSLSVTSNVVFDKTAGASRVYVRARRDTTNYHNAAVVFEGPRSDTADGDFADTRGYIVLPGRSDTLGSNLFIGNNTASAAITGDSASIRANQNCLELAVGLYYWAASTQRFRLGSADGSEFSVGNVGILTTAANAKAPLHVVGDVTLTGGVYTGGTASTKGTLRLSSAGVGTLTSLGVAKTASQPTADTYAQQTTLATTLTGDNVKYLVSFYGESSINQAGFNHSTGSVTGAQGRGKATGSSGTVAKLIGFKGDTWNTGAGTVTEAISINAGNVIGNAGTIGTAYGIYIDAISQGTTKYQLYSAGTNESYFAGPVNAASLKITNIERISAAGAATLTQMDADNVRADGNTVSATNAGGNLTVASNATGGLVLQGGSGDFSIQDTSANNRITIDSATGNINNIAGAYQTNGTPRISAAGAGTFSSTSAGALTATTGDFTGNIHQSGSVHTDLKDTTITGGLAVSGDVNSTAGEFQENGVRVVPVPIGGVIMWSGLSTNVPADFVVADGSAISRTTYVAYFTLVGTIHGSGDGSSTFNIPDLRDKFIVGAKQEDSGIPKTNLTGTLTQDGGTTTHTHTINGAHTHGASVGSDTVDQEFPAASVLTSVDIAEGGGEIDADAATAIPPYYALYYIVRVQ